MWNLKRVVVYFLIAFSLLNLTLLNVYANDDFDDILGVYEGTYSLGDSLRGTTVLIFMNGEKCQAMFNFYQIKGGCSSSSGSYLMDVVFDETSQTYSLNYLQWIDKPYNYHMVSFNTTQLNDTLTGYMSSNQDGYTYSYTNISLKKVSNTSFSYAGEHTHQLNESTASTVSKTCEKDGYTTGNCLICKNTMKTNIIPAEHQPLEIVVDIPATCTQTGKQHYTCSVCNNVVYEDVDIISHKYGEWKTISGNKLIPPIVMEKSCELCGDAQSQKDWSNVWITIVAVIVLIGASFGVVNYIKAFKKSK